MGSRLRAAKLLLPAAVAAALLGYGFARPDIAAVYSDPVSRVRTQDEAVYASSAVGLATGGGWLTPKLLGRYLLFKPPLLLWLSGASLKTLGISRFALRLPVLLAGVLATVLLFLWAARAHSLAAACAAGLLLASNPLWHTFSRVCYTDMLLVAAMAAALFTVARDPRLARPGSVLAFGLSTAAAVMAKNAAGALPVLVLLLFCALSRERPAASTVAKALAVAALVAAPWHIYQAVVHPQWFWADYVEIQLLKFGFQPPVQPVAEPAALFYVKRLFLTDPVLVGLAVLAAPGFARALGERRTGALLLLSWLLVAVAAVFLFRYRNLPYLLYAIPPLCLIAAVHAAGRWRRPVILLLAAAFCVKAAFVGRPWSLDFGSADPLPSAASLRWYRGLARPAELINVQPDDEFYSGALPLPDVRYCYIDPDGVARRYAPHLAWLGVTLETREFIELPRLEPLFREHLASWGLDSSEPAGTTISATSPADVGRIVAARPHSDFFLPAEVEAEIESAATHRAVRSGGRVFLLALEPRPPTHAQAGWKPSGAW